MGEGESASSLLTFSAIALFSSALSTRRAS